MDMSKASSIINVPVEQINWNKFMRSVHEAKVTEQGPIITINQAQERVIHKLEEALNLLKHVRIKNEESLAYINKPVDDLLSSLKYLPTEPSFDIIPTEIKTGILSYLCDTGAFIAASVCQEWKDILTPTLKNVDTVTIGKHCSNWYECEDNKCFMPQETLKASINLNLDVPLNVCYPLNDVDSDIVVQGLSSVSCLSLNGYCDCMSKDGEDYECAPILSNYEASRLFEVLEEKEKVMENLELRVMEELNTIDQNRLIDYLLKKTIKLTLDEGKWYSTMVDVISFVEKLKIKRYLLLELTLHHFNYDGDLDAHMADALCNVYSIKLEQEFHIKTATAKRLIQNILTRPIVMKYLTIRKKMDWRSLISSEDLKNLLNKMKAVEFVGRFTPEQVEAVKTLPGVRASLEEVVKTFSLDLQ